MAGGQSSFEQNTRHPARWSGRTLTPPEPAAVTKATGVYEPPLSAPVAEPFRSGGHKAHLGAYPQATGGGFGLRRFWGEHLTPSETQRRSLNRRSRLEISRELSKLAGRLFQVRSTVPQPLGCCEILTVQNFDLRHHAAPAALSSRSTK